MLILKRFPWVAITVCLSLFSCSPHNESTNNTTTSRQENLPATSEQFPNGEVIDKVICKADTSLSYALYLPSGYSEKKAFPVVFAFDPQGAGKLPVFKYKEFGEKYHCILAGSNNSRNGGSWEEIQKIASQFFSDVQSRFRINMQQVYLLGFSGGARIVNALTMNNGMITGVICCGAAAPANISPNPRSNYFFMGITGNEDFNYIELKKYDKVDLAGHNIKHTLLVFEGKHEWPPLTTMDEAFWWMQLNEMRKKTVTVNDSLIGERVQTASVELQTYLDKKQFLAAYECCRKTINFYEGLTDLALFFNTYQSLQSNKEIDQALQREETDWSKEENLKKKYVEAVQSNDLNWWKQDIAALNSKIKSSPKSEALIYKRIMGFLSVMMYVQTTQFMKQNNTAAADYFSKLYLLVDPNNSEAHYLAAEISAIQGNQEDAIKFLNSAIKNGYQDKPRLEHDNHFKNIRASAGFQKTVEEMKG
jgi:tetratricopeptide (TPR) repeat protein